MVKKINASLMNAGPLVSIDGVVIHNDAGKVDGLEDTIRDRQIMP